MEFDGNSKNAPWVFVVIGVVFVLFSVNLIKSDADVKKSMDSQVQSSYVSHDISKRISSSSSSYSLKKRKKMYTPIYHYSVNGQEYTCKARVSSSIKSTKNKTVYYNSNNPENCLVEADNFSKNIFLILGLVVLGVGVLKIFLSKE